MVSSRIRTAAAILLIWMTVVAVVMMLARTINIEIFFILWLVGALIVVELLSLRMVRPRWKKVQFLILGGSIAVFVGIVIVKIIVILVR